MKWLEITPDKGFGSSVYINLGKLYIAYTKYCANYHISIMWAPHWRK